MSKRQTHADLGKAAERLDEALTSEMAAERHGRWASLGIVALFMAVVGVFCLVNYLFFRGEWTEENITASVRKEWAELEPVMSTELRTLGATVAPVYAAEFRAQLPELAPEMGRVLRLETERFAGDLQADASARLELSMNRTVEHAVEEMFASYPGLEDDVERAAVEQRFRAALEESFTGALQHFNETCTADAAAFQEAVMNVPESDLTTRELGKKFARLWIQWLDEWVAQQ